MKQISAVAILVLCSAMPCHAAPPTVVPSPGYDARLQESRTASRPPATRSVVPVFRPAAPRRTKRHHLH